MNSTRKVIIGSIEDTRNRDRYLIDKLMVERHKGSLDKFGRKDEG